MVEIELDGIKVEVPPGSMVMHAAEKAGVFIPHFCYHKKLSIAANCRMCLVDIEKAPKAMPACATPVAQGMVVRTKSEKAVKAQRSVMEFLLINHPLDCPICDQGGECQLQDLAVGYGQGTSRYTEEKRVVPAKDVGPLISMEEMSRCIHCTRCVRFGQEIAGTMELGMSHRGEHSEIETFLGQTVDSELSGNMIDLCPVGALTSKPFRYQARTWELSRRKSISPHDSTGANLVIQVKQNRVVRVLPLENEAVNECWIADRDRFSYEALNGEDRLRKPMVRQDDGQWVEVEWKVALERVATALETTRGTTAGNQIGALVSPHSTLEEIALVKRLMVGLGSGSIDHRLRHGEMMRGDDRVRWLGAEIQTLSTLSGVLVFGSNLRKDHPLFAQRIRQAAKRGGRVLSIDDVAPDWAMPIHLSLKVESSAWIDALTRLASEVARLKGVAPPRGAASSGSDEVYAAMAQSLLGEGQKAILLGNKAAHHPRANALLYLANWIADQTGALCGYLTEAANTVGAQWAGAIPSESGLDAQQMLQGQASALILYNVEPGLDTWGGAEIRQSVRKSAFVVTFSPFVTNLDCSDVVLPIAPFTETSGTFVNAEARLQSFRAVVKAEGEVRPGWKVLRALGELLHVEGMEAQSSEDVLRSLLPDVQNGALIRHPRLSNAAYPVNDWTESSEMPCAASIYALDGLVRRSPSLQATKDGQLAPVLMGGRA